MWTRMTWVTRVTRMTKVTRVTWAGCKESLFYRLPFG